MAAIFDFNGSRRLGERKKLLWGRSTVRNKKKGGGGGVKILAPAPVPAPPPPPTPPPPPPATVYSNSKQRALDIRDYTGKTPRQTSALRLSRRNTKCLRQFLVSTSVRSARSYSFTIKMKDFSLHFNVSLQKLD